MQSIPFFFEEFICHFRGHLEGMKNYKDLESLIRGCIPETDNVTFKSASGSGLSGVSSTPSLATATTASGKEEIELFIKVCEKDTFPFFHNTNAKTMEKEIHFYEEILPTMREFLDKRAITDNALRIDKLMPRYYGSGLIKDGDIVVILENIQAIGFKALGKKELFNFEQAQKSITALALFHATTFAMKVMDKMDWVKLPNMVDFIHCQELEDIYSVFHLEMNQHYLRLLKVVSRNKGSNKTVEKHIHRICPVSFIDQLEELQPYILKILRDCRSPVEPQGVLCHGDYHMWNVAFNQDGSRLKMFDFQILCYASGMTDLHYFLSQSVTPEMRKTHKDDFLTKYSDTFLKAGNAMGLSSDQLELFSLEQLQEEYRVKSPFLYVFGLHYFIIRLIENTEKFSTTKTMKDDNEIIQTLDQCGPNTWKILQHAFDLLEEIQKMGTLEIMKRSI